MARKNGFTSYAPGGLVGESVGQLAAAVQRELSAIAATFDAIGGGLVLVPYDAAPTKTRPLMLVYADGTNWNPGGGEGVYIRNLANTTWTKL